MTVSPQPIRSCSNCGQTLGLSVCLDCGKLICGWAITASSTGPAESCVTDHACKDESVRTVVIETIEECSGRSPIDDAATLWQLGMDAEDIAGLAESLEDHFSIHITDEEMGEGETVGSLIALVEGRIA